MLGGLFAMFILAPAAAVVGAFLGALVGAVVDLCRQGPWVGK